MPGTIQRLLDLLGVARDARKFDNTLLGSDLDYGTSAIEMGKGHAGVLFPPLLSER